MDRELIVLLGSERVGVVTQGPQGRFEFKYEQSWRDHVDSYPLSLSMPMMRASHGDSVVRPYLEGLLPDNRDVLNQWAREFHVSAGNPFALLSRMGMDCAGAVRFADPRDIDRLLHDDNSRVEWCTDSDVAHLLKDLAEHHGTGRPAGSSGYFSLGGAQPKTALLLEDGRWGVPSGRIPTSHILKPPAQRDLGGFEINEHLCLRLAGELGIPVPVSEIRRFDDQIAIVVSRFDRLRSESGELVRIHQEDVCQALSVPPWRKYESEGGPGADALVALLMSASDEPDVDVATVLDALALNWVMVGTDAHAKNYSLLIGPGSVRLAPIYDLVSVLPYTRAIPFRKARLAMRLGTEYHIWKIGVEHWTDLATRCGLDVEPVLDRIASLISLIPDAVSRAVASVREDGLDHDIISVLEREIRGRADQCLERLARG
jgi:serine/threonine-protein kinase HipA